MRPIFLFGRTRALKALSTASATELAKRTWRTRCDKEKRMKSSTEDRIEGTVHEAKGAVKEKVGEVLHSPDLETEGKDEKLAGQVQQNVAQVKKLFKK